MTKGSRKSQNPSSRTPRRKVEFEGATYSLAIISKGRDIPREEKIKIAEAVCQLYATDRFSLAECLKECGVSSSNTWFLWAEEIAEIGQLYSEAQTRKALHYRTHLKERGLTMAEKLLCGYFVEALEHEGEAVVDDEGRPIDGEFKMIRVKRRQIYIQPKVEVWKTIMYNFDPNNFRRDQDQNNGEQPHKISIEIAGGTLPPITREQDIDPDV